MSARARGAALAAVLGAGCENPEEIHFTVVARNAHHITFVGGPDWTTHAEYLGHTAREAERWCARSGEGARAAQANEGVRWVTIFHCVAPATGEPAQEQRDEAKEAEPWRE